MATIKIVDVISQAETIIQDKTNTRWPKQEWLDWFNGAVLAVIGLRPDANIANEEYDTTGGQSLQTLPASGLRLINVVYNVGTGKQIRRIEKRMLDDQVDNWYNASGSDVDHYVYDDRDPKSFWIYPTPASSHKLRIIYSEAPSSITISNFTTDTQVLPIDDSYMNPILDHMLYRAYSKDADYAENASRAAQHMQAFQVALGAKTEGDTGISASNNRAGIIANG
ncbi:hypothetical protein J7384_17080 [Endozoicomonas sp. G2_1]|uniref:phage adaptor protein n=1 Tax=Endozoicomonas sp. G2_1 TaxID=2821091 RepID=UPI001ADCE09E|nr:DUF6682 family protein [Endozoicomonas sp. G2_1]MBO9492078.1 hypothetical protein [Endozoicomonas sp. G2_1]